MTRLLTLLICLLTTAPVAAGPQADPDSAPPNIILIYCDNLGYGDVGCFSSPRHATPRLDAMAAAGMRLTHFYSASGVCTPSRASLMTGCYPRRIGLHNTDPDGIVLRPVSPNGLAPQETTIAEVLRDAGYTTAAIGKWHLGDQPAFLPTRQGFQTYFGIPYSDDMTQRDGKPWPPLPLMEGEQVIEAPVDRDLLTRRYTERAVAFIRQHQDRPFFLYLAQAMPGSTPHPFASPAFQGRSNNGPWGDSIEELDWSTGQILDTLDQLQLDGRTLVIWTSDNGAPRRSPPQGSNLPLGGWGYSTREGGMRVPCIVRWTGTVPPGAECDAVTSTIDLLPTLAAIAGAPLPPHPIDGHNILPLLTGQADAVSPHEAFYYYQADQLQAVRSDRWKLFLVPPDRRGEAKRDDAVPPLLFDVVDDPAEQHDLADAHPQVVARLQRLAEAARRELGDVGRPGAGQRPVGRVENPTPRQLTGPPH